MVTVTKLTNGLLYDASSIPSEQTGVVNALKLFAPFNFPSVQDVSLFNDKVIITVINGKQFNLCYCSNPTEIIQSLQNNCFPMSSVDGATPTSLEDLFYKIIALM